MANKIIVWKVITSSNMGNAMLVVCAMWISLSQKEAKNWRKEEKKISNEKIVE